MTRYGNILRLSLVLVLVVSAGCSGQRSNPIEAPPANAQQSSNSCTPLYVVGDSAEATRSFELESEELCRRFGVKPVLRHPSMLISSLEDYVAESRERVDLAIIAPRHLNVFVEKGLVRPIDQWIDPKDPWFTDILPVYRNLYMRAGDHYYGFVYDGDSHLLFYRNDLFDKLDLSVPTTWTEHDAVARSLAESTLPGGTRYGTAMVGREGKAYIWFAERYASLGGEYFDAQMTPLIDGPLGVKVLTDLTNLQREVAPEALYDWEDLNRALFAGTLPMAVQWSDTARFSFNQEVWHSKVAGRLSWAEVPGGEPGTPRGGIWFGRILVLAANSAQPDVAAQVAHYMTSPEVSGRMITRADTINDPYRYSHLANPEAQTLFPNQEQAKAFYETLSRSLERPMADLTIPGGWDYTQALDHSVLQVLRGEATPEQALREAAEEWEVITNRYGRDGQRAAYEQWRTWVRQGNTQ